MLTVGDDLEQAFLRMELVEHLARIGLVSRQLGRTERLSAAEVKALLAKRAKAGLGPEGRAAQAGSAPREDLVRLVTAEVKEALRPKRG